VKDPNRVINDWLDSLPPAAKAFWTVFLIVLLVGGGIIMFSFIDKDAERSHKESMELLRQIEKEEAQKQQQ
jgi:hypothetical protein